VREIRQIHAGFTPDARQIYMSLLHDSAEYLHYITIISTLLAISHRHIEAGVDYVRLTASLANL
jgi:hypothetical protein